MPKLLMGKRDQSTGAENSRRRRLNQEKTQILRSFHFFSAFCVLTFMPEMI